MSGCNAMPSMSANARNALSMTCHDMFLRLLKQTDQGRNVAVFFIYG